MLRGAAARGCTVLLSSHLLHEVEQVADQLIVIGRGRLLAEGSPTDVLGTGSLEEAYLTLTTTTDRSAS